MANKISSNERKWRAESDAETMARYEEIMNDSARRNAAIKVARTRAEELKTRADVMQRVAGSKGKTKKS